MPKQGEKPSGRVTSDKWFVRVYGEENFLRQKCREIPGWIDTHLCHGVFHACATNKENPHVHIIISLTNVLQKPSFDLRIKKLFGVAGAQYSTKPWDGRYDADGEEGAGSYLYHEGDDSPVLCSKGLTELHINNFKEVNKQVQKTVLKNKQKAEKKLVGKAVAEYKDVPFDDTIEEKIFIFMLSLCKNGENHYPGDYGLKKYVQEAVIQLCPDNEFMRFAEHKYRAIFRNEHFY